MKKFVIISSVKMDAEENGGGYDGPAVVLACTSDPSVVLFFPVPPEKADIIGYLTHEGGYDINTETLGLYKTMIDSWSNGDRFLSGIVMDCVNSDKGDKGDDVDDDVMQVEILISDSISGLVDSIVPVSFLNSIILAAIQKIEIIMSDKLLNKLLPQEESEDEEDFYTQSHFPEDKKIIDIVKDIMEGKIQRD